MHPGSELVTTFPLGVHRVKLPELICEDFINRYRLLASNLGSTVNAFTEKFPSQHTLGKWMWLCGSSLHTASWRWPGGTST